MTFASTLLVMSCLSLGVACPSPDGPGSAEGDQAPDFEALFNEGIRFTDFLASADRRTESWHAHYRDGKAEGAWIERARAVSGEWRLLVVAEDWCGDSVNTVPYIARLVEEVAGLDMRVIDSKVGRGVMEAHRTPDDRAATPTVVLLDRDFEEVGCWVERPSVLQTWFLDNQDELEEDDLYDQKYAWYDEDRGRETVREIVELLEATSAPIPCPAGGGS